MAKTVDNVVVSGLYRQYGPFLRARILSQTGCAAAADDIVQEVFIKLLKGHDLSGVRNMKSYLYRIAMNATVDYFRSRKRNAAMVEGESIEDRSDACATDPTAEEMLIYRDSIIQLHRKVGQISPLCQKIFWLSRGEGYRNAEIAQMLNVCISTVEKNITKASRRCQAA